MGIWSGFVHTYLQLPVEYYWQLDLKMVPHPWLTESVSSRLQVCSFHLKSVLSVTEEYEPEDDLGEATEGEIRTVLQSYMEDMTPEQRMLLKAAIRQRIEDIEEEEEIENEIQEGRAGLFMCNLCHSYHGKSMSRDPQKIAHLNNFLGMASHCPPTRRENWPPVFTPSVSDRCNSFGTICVYVCLALTSERTNIQTWILVWTSSGRISRSSSKVKVIGQRSRSPGQKTFFSVRCIVVIQQQPGRAWCRWSLAFCLQDRSLCGIQFHIRMLGLRRWVFSKRLRFFYLTLFRVEYPDSLVSFVHPLLFLGLPGITGCVDGCLFKIKKPSQLANEFVCRKGFAAINAMVRD